MHHVYIRIIIALIWLVAAIAGGLFGNLGMSALYTIIGGMFLYSAYSTWEKEKNDKGDR